MTAAARRLRAILLIVIALVVGLLWLPFDPLMPRPGIDESWMQAVNQAASHHLRFGTDVVFNYGPLAAVHTHMYVAGIWPAVMAASALLAAGFVIATVIWLRAAHWIWPALLATFLLLDPTPRESTFLVYPLVAVLALTELPSTGRHAWWPVGLMYAALGLLPVIKLSSLLPVAGAVLCTALLGWQLGRRALVALAPALPISSMVCFWLVSGQRLADLGPYLRSAPWVTAGYSEAMAIPERSRLGPPLVLMTVVVGGLVLVVALTRVALRDRTTILPLLMLAGTSTIAAKEAMVRADVWHVFTLWPVLAIGVWFLWRAGLSALPRAVSVLALLAIWGAMVNTWPSFALSESWRQDRHTLAGPADLILHPPSSLPQRYDEVQAGLARSYAMPSTPGTVDLYPDELGALFAAGERWDPRPGLQSMSAYTPELVTRNRDHLVGPGSPDSLIFGIGAIDDRLPALEDGASWPTILSRYEPTGRAAWGYQVLARRPLPVALTARASTQLHGRLGEWISLPATAPGQALEVSIDLEPTPAGRVRTTLWRPPIVRIDLAGVIGPLATHRFLPGVARVPFLISPYVASADQFVDLYSGGNDLDRVNRIRLHADGFLPAMFWSRRVSITARVVQLPTSTRQR